MCDYGDSQVVESSGDTKVDFDGEAMESTGRVPSEARLRANWAQISGAGRQENLVSSPGAVSDGKAEEPISAPGTGFRFR